MSNLICPSVTNCPVYKNWVEKTRDERINIILNSGDKYHCLALTALDDLPSQGGIPASKELVRKVAGLNNPNNYPLEDIECSQITILNLLRKK